ncbi:Type 1 glutamine amidotransferase-like domain-containing protein, partial [Escherichia coli]|uniref:Type 1 glutamine amidotransferase-like domain-containing protein n=1 Tax=Escherichia coli TaxID=562 RepID=UPI00215B1C3A
AYTERTRQAFAPIGLEVSGLHDSADPQAALASTELIIVGGGNTFQLLRECRDRQLLDTIASQVRGGTPYIGWSAGANLACP